MILATIQSPKTTLPRHKMTAIAIKKSSNTGSNGETSAWQRPENKNGLYKVGGQFVRRKRNRKRPSPRNNNKSAGIADGVLAQNDTCSPDPAGSSTASPPHSASSISGSHSTECKKDKAAYDPSSNPYSLENYKRDPELQITLESQVVKETAKTQQTNPLEPGAASPLPLTPLFPSPKTQQVLSSIDRELNGALSLPPTFTPHARSAQTTPRSVAAPSYQRLNQNKKFYGGPSRRGGYANHNGQGGARNYHNNKRSMHHIPLRSFSLHEHLALQDPSHCPHGDLTPEQLINIKIRKRNVCYVVGLPISVATEQKLRAHEWFGQFGTIATIAINRNQKSTLANSIPAHITYDNNISALNAINFCNKFVFDDGRKLKATFGTQHYCRWFISINKKCTNVYCGFRHSWCRADDIITAKDIADFKGICPLQCVHGIVDYDFLVLFLMVKCGLFAVSVHWYTTKTENPMAIY